MTDARLEPLDLRFRVRQLRAQDVPACVDVANAVGWSTEPDKWRWMLSVGRGYGAELEEGTLLGTLLVIPYGTELAMIAMMIVRSTHQRQGIGRALMEGAIASSGCSVLCLYATAAGQKLYRPFGFVDDGATTRFEGEPKNLGSDLVALRTMSGADIPHVIELDEEAQGARRERLVNSFEGQPRDGAYVVERSGRVVGFGMAFVEQGARRLGPIVAARDDDAVALADRLAAGADRVRLDLEPGEEPLRAWARARGLDEGESSPRMTRGPAGLPGARTMSRALLGRPFG